VPVLLVIDNYDSFTWNLVQLLGELGVEPRVHRNDRISLDAIEALQPRWIVVSPGPCTPAEAGISVECIRRFGPRTPVLGVCLGHQAIGAAYGAVINRAEAPMHGKISAIEHTGTAMFAGLTTPLRVARYHSLQIDPRTVPAELEVLAWTAGRAARDEIQAVRHRRFPVWGVQFHPESIASEGGRVVLRNFLDLQ
jgi:anthranilate synthase component 2